MTTTDGSGRVVARRARPAELKAVGALTLQAYRVDGYVSDEADYVRELLGAATRDADAELWVAVEGGGDRVEGPAALLGTVTFCPLGSPFREVAVDDSERSSGCSRWHRRRGVAASHGCSRSAASTAPARTGRRAWCCAATGG